MTTLPTQGDQNEYVIIGIGYNVPRLDDEKVIIKARITQFRDLQRNTTRYALITEILPGEQVTTIFGESFSYSKPPSYLNYPEGTIGVLTADSKVEPKPGRYWAILQKIQGQKAHQCVLVTRTPDQEPPVEELKAFLF
jgi:hypothetical protein